jgi:hypothetical protein
MRIIKKQVSRENFEATLKIQVRIDWFFGRLLSREKIDFKFTDVLKSKDSISFTIKNRTFSSCSGMELKGKIVFKSGWILK